MSAANSKHTPGPWSALEISGSYDSWVVIDAGENAIVDSTTERTARLIAAAPELLAALECLLRGIEEYVPEMNGNAVTVACAAIARAKGEAK